MLLNNFLSEHISYNDFIHLLALFVTFYESTLDYEYII